MGKATRAERIRFEEANEPPYNRVETEGMMSSAASAASTKSCRTVGTRTSSVVPEVRMRCRRRVAWEGLVGCKCGGGKTCVAEMRAVARADEKPPRWKRGAKWK